MRTYRLTLGSTSIDGPDIAARSGWGVTVDPADFYHLVVSSDHLDIADLLRQYAELNFPIGAAEPLDRP